MGDKLQPHFEGPIAEWARRRTDHYGETVLPSMVRIVKLMRCRIG